MNPNKTNDQLNELADKLFNELLESDTYDNAGLNDDDVTLVMCKLAMKCSEYAADAINF